jgi:hypothetical protein
MDQYSNECLKIENTASKETLNIGYDYRISSDFHSFMQIEPETGIKYQSIHCNRSHLI